MTWTIVAWCASGFLVGYYVGAFQRARTNLKYYTLGAEAATMAIKEQIQAQSTLLLTDPINKDEDTVGFNLKGKSK